MKTSEICTRIQIIILYSILKLSNNIRKQNYIYKSIHVVIIIKHIKSIIHVRGGLLFYYYYYYFATIPEVKTYTRVSAKKRS